MHFELWLQWAQGSGGTQNAVQSRRGNSNGKDSIVRMSLSAAELIGVMHERIASPFLCTVQAPQRAIPQPNFVSVSCRMSRTYHKRGMLGSPSKVRSIPFTLSFAAHRSFLTYVATVVEVEVGDDGEIRIPRIDTALDAGLVANPEATSAQFQGAVVFGTSIVRSGEITAKNGVIQQSNFNDYPVARINEVPTRTDVYITESSAPPSGVGEPGIPPFVAAFCDAIFAATGKRVRDLPLSSNSVLG